MNDLLPQTEAAKHLGLTPRTLIYWRSIKDGPRCYRLGARYFYKVSDLDAYLEANAIEPAAKNNAA